jgi:cysteinyl-tRNA synthetase
MEAPSEAPSPTIAQIVLYDTMTAVKRPLALLEPGRCGLYVCGPTVYDMSHIGHARAAIVPDVLVRALRATGLAVTYVRNITDIDDKIIALAQVEGVAAMDVADRYADAYHSDMAALGMLDPDVEPRVSSHLEPIIALISRLVERGLAYAAEGDVYYRVAAFADYGKLGKRKPEELLEGAGAASRWTAQGATPRLRAVEGGQARRAGLASRPGAGAAGLAHRVLGDERRPTWARPSTSTPAGAT